MNFLNFSQQCIFELQKIPRIEKIEHMWIDGPSLRSISKNSIFEGPATQSHSDGSGRKNTHVTQDMHTLKVR